jgi:UPF0042 nucleotide-binding protein
VMISIVMYGCRHGTHPEGLHLIYDCRAISNPHHDKRLRYLNGFDQPVRDEVMRWAPARELVRRIKRETLELCRLYEERPEDPASLPVKVGVYCTGGRHRSVVIGTEVAKEFLLEGLPVQLELRDRAKWLDNRPGGK